MEFFCIDDSFQQEQLEIQCHSNNHFQVAQLTLNRPLELRKVGYNESVFAMAGYSVIRHAGTAVDFYLIAENNICRLIINVKPRTKAE